jgi:branched-chain amino acid transport system ATP-binding protein
MLEVSGLRVSYQRVEAVKGVDLKVSRGEVVALLGPNGAGKTSLLRAVSQVVPHAGDVVFDGTPLRGRNPQQIARLGLIHVPEGRRVFPTLTVHENLQIGLSARSGRDGMTLDDVYELFPLLKPLRGRGGWALSGGEQQMVAIGRALLAAPRLLMLDEPSLGLAPAVARTMFDALAEIRHQTPLLVVEQNTTLALSLSERAYVLVSGEVVLAKDSAELGERDRLLDAYLGRKETVHA